MLWVLSQAATEAKNSSKVTKCTSLLPYQRKPLRTLQKTTASDYRHVWQSVVDSFPLPLPMPVSAHGLDTDSNLRLNGRLDLRRNLTSETRHHTGRVYTSATEMHLTFDLWPFQQWPLTWWISVPSFIEIRWLRAGCRNARLTARLGNRELTVTARLTCGRVARSTVSKP